jgi:uncharacterized phage protein (TIGR02220 family)
MSRLVIPIQFFDALKKCPPIYRLMWVEWLANANNLFHPKFCENLRYDNVPREKITECYAIGIKHLQEGIYFEEQPKTKDIEQKPLTKEVIDYLNLKAKTTYKPSSSTTIQLISGRVSEGFTKDDFLKVIDNKVAQWLGTEQQQYLRPITLFSKSKFESYLNQPSNGTRKKPSSNLQATRNAIDQAKSKLFD